MKLNFIGIGGAFCPKLGCNCAYVRENEKILFVDFGMDVYRKVVEYNLLEGVEKVYVVLTHMHGDHIGGLFTFIDYCYFSKKIVVKILDNSTTFTNKLVKLLDFTGIQSDKFSIIKMEELGFDFNLSVEKTAHTPILECYSLIFESEGKKILYTSDTNDIDNIKRKIDDPDFIKIYCEVGEKSPVHIEFEDLKMLNKNKLILMHFQSLELLVKAEKAGFEFPTYLK